MKHIFYSCILATTPIILMHATTQNTPPSLMHEIIFDYTVSEESPFCNDSACECRMLLDDSSELAILRSGKQRDKTPEQISFDQIHAYAKQFARRNFPIDSRDKHQTSLKALKKALKKVASVSSMLTTQLTKSGSTTISKEHLNRTLKTALSSNFAKSKIVTFELTKSIDKHTKKLFAGSDYKLTDIPPVMRKEFAHERAKLALHLKKMMDQHKIAALSEHEIKDAVAKTYKPFIQRMQYVHLWNWAMAETANLRKDDRTKTASSYLIPNPESAKLRKYVSFLYK